MSTTTSRSTRSAFGVVEVIVGLVMLAALLTGLGYLVGPNGLGLIHGKIHWPVIAESQYEMTVKAQLDTPVTIEGAPTWCDSASGTVDCATGKPPVELGGPYTGSVGFPGPSGTQRWAWVTAGPVLVAAVLWLILRMLRSARRGDPFTPANLRRMQGLAVLVGVGGTLVAWSGTLLDRWLLENSAVAPIVANGYYFSFVPLVGGLLIAALAEVWRRGIQLRDDVEGLV